MLKNYLKNALRNILNNRTTTFLNLFGLSIGLAVFLLILLFVQFELSYDKYHDDCDRIYRIVQKQVDRKHYIELHGTNIIAVTHAPLAAALVENFPEILSAVRVNFRSNVLLTTNSKKFFENNICFADPSLFKVFSFQMIKGDPEKALDDLHSIILTERMAKKYFDAEDPVGKWVRYDNRFDLKVMGIVENIPENSHFTMGFIIPFKKFNELNNADGTDWDKNWHCFTYFKFHKKADINGFEKKLVPLAEKASQIVGVRNDFLIQPITSIHLHSHLFIEITENSDIKYVFILLSIALLVLVIACLNYINLTTACSFKRKKEVGVRKVVGAEKRQLIFQFISESVMVTIFALIVSAFIFSLALPAFNSLIDRNLSLDQINTPLIILLLIGMLLSIGILAGLYPALFISSYRTITALKTGTERNSKGLRLRNLLVTVQFSISILLILCTLVIKGQISFIHNKDVGYDKEKIVIFPLRDPVIRRNIQVIKSELLKEPSIINVAVSGNLPSHFTDFQSIPASVVENRGAVYRTGIDYDFLELYGIELVEGRNFSRDFSSDGRNAVIINETAVKTFGLKSPVGKIFKLHSSGDGKRIIGVVKDFHFRSLHHKIDPMYFEMVGAYLGQYLSVKVRGDQYDKTIRAVKDQMAEISTNFPFEYYFFDKRIDAYYHFELKTGTVISVFSLFAVFIACIGLLGLSIFVAEQKKKEISIRKVLGAKSFSILVLVSKDFLRSIIISIAVAWPLGYFFMTKWLQNFAYRVNLSVWVFLISGLAALAIAMLTISSQTIKAAISNPADSLRYE
ncbi:MAG: ABC transporter permease [Candidatus Aminicenantes bacterium]|nr:ABC transporter permease [Candidatus Aminicenantes bacterium]